MQDEMLVWQKIGYKLALNSSVMTVLIMIIIQAHSQDGLSWSDYFVDYLADYYWCRLLFVIYILIFLFIETFPWAGDWAWTRWGTAPRSAVTVSVSTRLKYTSYTLLIYRHNYSLWLKVLVNREWIQTGRNSWNMKRNIAWSPPSYNTL